MPFFGQATVAVVTLGHVGYFLIAGFGLGIVAYHVVLFFCTREKIYLLLTASLLSYVISIGQGNRLWILPFDSENASQLFLDTLSLILFILFIKQFLNLFAYFQTLNSNIAFALNTYIALGVLIIFGYGLFPHPFFFTARIALMGITSLTAVFGIHRWYLSIQQFRSFNIVLAMFFLILAYYFFWSILKERMEIDKVSHVGFMGGILMFLLFSRIIINRLNIDREHKAIAQKSTLYNLQKYQALYDNAIEGLFTVLADGRLLSANPALRKLLHLQLNGQAIVDLPFLHSYFAEPQQEWIKLINRLNMSEIVEDVEILGEGNVWYGLSARRAMINNIEFIEGSLVDITQRKVQEQQLMYLARHDALTGLYGRTEFESFLQSAISSPGEHTLLFIDVDQFKVINDTCGHAAGDECLRQISAIFKAHINKQDMLARLGGDEFGIVLCNQDQLTGKEGAERLRRAFEGNYFQWLQRIFKTTISIGLIVLDEQITDSEQALSMVDAACYEAKYTGRNRVVVNCPNEQSTINRHSQMNMVATLTQAFREDGLSLFQQAIVPLLTNEMPLRYFEVLARLPTSRGLLDPGAFLPAAQRYHLLPELDCCVFKNTCAWLAQGENALRTGMVNINLSPQTLVNSKFLVFVQCCLQEYALDAEKICFEITEYSALDNFPQVLGHILKLRALGFKFALDDFGSGFASFDYLKRLPVDFIKIDGQFIRNISQDKASKTLVRAVADISHALGKKVIAESVEDEETAELLKGFNIDYAQGYYYGMPSSISEQGLWMPKIRYKV